MIERIRSEYDNDYPNQLHQPNSFKSKNEPHEIRCSICGKPYFADDETFKNLEKMMKYDLDNQFLCDDCEHEYQDAIFE